MSDDKGSDTRERLFEAAIRVFAERGFEAATVREICGRAKANVAAVNYYYGDKESLYRQVVAEIFRSSARTRTPFLPRDADPVDRLRTYVKASFEEILPMDHEEEGLDSEVCQAMGVIFMVELARPTRALDDIVENYIGPDCEELRDILLAILGPDAPEEQVDLCMGSVIGQVLHYYYSLPIIERMSRDTGVFYETEGFLDVLVEHVLEFSLGGMARLAGCGGETRRNGE